MFATDDNNCAAEAYERHFRDSLESLHGEQRYRVFTDIERISGRFPAAKWRRSDGTVTEITVWCSNDYLGMGQHPEVVSALTATAHRCGAGAGGTCIIGGNNSPLVDLEGELADLHGKEASLVFTSGYVSNQASISTIGKLIPDCVVLSDAFNHNSIIEGVRHQVAKSGFSATTISVTLRRCCTRQETAPNLSCSNPCTRWMAMWRRSAPSATLRTGMAR